MSLCFLTLLCPDSCPSCPLRCRDLPASRGGECSFRGRCLAQFILVRGLRLLPNPCPPRSLSGSHAPTRCSRDASSSLRATVCRHRTISSNQVFEHRDCGVQLLYLRLCLLSLIL